MFFPDKKEKEINKKLKMTCEIVKKHTTTIKGLIRDMACEEAEDNPKKKQLSESIDAIGERFDQGSKPAGEWGLNGIIN